MAHPNLTLIGALRQAASNLKNGAHYSWGHHGSCNCGHLLQVVTHLSKEEILQHAHTGMGEWTELAETVCEVTQLPAHQMIARLQAIGLTATDIHNLEYLQDREVLQFLSGGFKWLKKNLREDVVTYFDAMATMLEEELIENIDLPEMVPAELEEEQRKIVHT